MTISANAGLRGQSLVVYQHIARNRTAEEQIAARLTALHKHLERAEGTLALRWRRFTSRVYFVMPAADHAELLAARCSAFLASRWGRHFTPYG